MTAASTYSTGTLSIGAGATSVVGAGGANWSGQNAVPGDTLAVTGFAPIKILDVTNATALAIDAWPFAAVPVGTTYRIYQDSLQRATNGNIATAVDQMVSALQTDGFYVFVTPTQTAPDPSLGQDNQYAFQADSGKLWQKTGGAWNFLGIYKGFNLRGAYAGATTYSSGDVVSFTDGSSYVWNNATPGTGQSPPNATYWQLLAAKGATGNTGATGPSYAATSTTSLTVATGSQTFATQAGLAYLPGARVRISNGANYMEGQITAYDAVGGSMTVNVSKVSGSGTFASWNISLAGDPGSGDMLSTNYLSELSGNLPLARQNLGLDAAWRNERLAKTAAYTVANGDKGKTIALGGNALYTLTFNAASGFDANFSVAVVNEDVFPGSGRAKYIDCSASGGPKFYLWPQQSVVIYNQNDVWYVLGRSRWKLAPSTTYTISTDFVNGSDTDGVADGLATGAGAFKTIQHAIHMVLNNFDWFATEFDALVVVQAAAGQTDTQQIHFSPHGGMPLAQGGVALTIDGNNSTLSTTGVSAIQLFFGAVLQLRRLTITSSGTGAHGIELRQGSKLYLADGMNLSTVGNAQIYVDEFASLDIQNSYFWGGSMVYHIFNNGGRIGINASVSASLTGNSTASGAVVWGQFPGKTDLNSMTWNNGSFSVTGQSYNISFNSVMLGKTGMPGTTAGTANTGGIAV